MAVQKVQSTAHIGTSQIAKDAGRINEAHLLTMFSAVANAGLTCWAPDVLGDADSMYNTLHQQIAISTLKIVAASFGYTFMNVDLSFLEDHRLLIGIYRNFVFSYMGQKTRKEEKTPGRNLKDSELINIYKRRDRVRNLSLSPLALILLPASRDSC